MALEKLTKTDTLLNLYNQILQDLTIAQVQVEFFQKLSLVNMEPQITKELAQWQMNVEQAKNRLEIVSEQLDKENKANPQERSIN